MLLKETIKEALDNAPDLLKNDISREKDLLERIQKQINKEEHTLFKHTVKALQDETIRSRLLAAVNGKQAQRREALKKIDAKLLNGAKVPPTSQESVLEIFRYSLGVDEWTCLCGYANYTRFCVKCGKEKSFAVSKRGSVWVCPCGTENFDKYCTACGKKR